MNSQLFKVRHIIYVYEVLFVLLRLEVKYLPNLDP